MADKIEIVRLDAEGNVKETLHDDFPAGWSAARTEFGKLRHGEHGTAAAAEGGCLELRVGGVSKMSTKAVEKERKKRPSTKDAADKPKKKPAAKKTNEDAPAEDDGEPKMKKQSGYMYHNAQNREAAKSEIEAENPGDFNAFGKYMKGTNYKESFQESGDTESSVWSCGLTLVRAQTPSIDGLCFCLGADRGLFAGAD